MLIHRGDDGPSFSIYHISAFLDQANELIRLRTHTEDIKIAIGNLEKEIESTKMCDYT